MTAQELEMTLDRLNVKIAEFRNIWHTIPHSIQDKLDSIFQHDQGVGYHSWQTSCRLDEININDCEKAVNS